MAPLSGATNSRTRRSTGDASGCQRLDKTTTIYDVSLGCSSSLSIYYKTVDDSDFQEPKKHFSPHLTVLR